jgi:hypothetical protein
MQVASLEDGRIDENMLALTIGLSTETLFCMIQYIHANNYWNLFIQSLQNRILGSYRCGIIFQSPV